jgi:ABC-type lipoprotein export system ATPase subunit
MILALLRRIADERATAVLMATHSFEATGAADTIVRLQDGRVQSPDRTEALTRKR